MKKLIKVIQIALVGLVLLLPLFFLPLTADFFMLNKQVLLIITTSFLVGASLVRQLLSKEKAEWRHSPLDWSVILLTLVAILLAGFTSPNRPLAFLGGGLTLPLITLSLFYFVVTNNYSTKLASWLLKAISVGAVVLGLIAIATFFKINQGFSTEWLKNAFFSPAGGPIALTSFLVIALIPNLILLVKRFSRQDWPATAGHFLSSLVILFGLTFTWQQLLGQQGNIVTILPYRTAWDIAIETLKQAPFTGVGLGNYRSAFSRFRSVGFNQTPLWHLRFSVASSLPLHLLTVGGLALLTAFTILIVKGLRLMKKQFRGRGSRAAIAGGFLAALLTLFFLPYNLLSLFLLFLFLALMAAPAGETKSFRLDKTVRQIGTVLPTLGLAGLLFLYGRVWLADLYLQKSLVAFSRNQGAPTYQHQQKAIRLNPYSPTYRRAFSQTNLALANSLAQQSTLSDQDRERVVQFVQQAVNEAKSAISLNQTDAANWDNLAQLYRQLLNFAEGADQWTVAAYQQAINLEPTNPQLRLGLGGLFYGLGNYEAATLHFQSAANLKPDWANAFYNLSASLREQERYQEAYLAMQQVLVLVPINSEEFQKAKVEFDQLAEKLPKPEAAETVEAVVAEEDRLTEPETIAVPAIEPPIELPEETAPETEEVVEAE